MWPIALPQTKVVHLMRLAWATLVVSINQSETSQANAIIQSGCESQLYQAYRLRIQSKSKVNPKWIRQKDWNKSQWYQAYWLRIQRESKANTSKGWEQIDWGSKRIGCVSKANPKQIHQKDGNKLTAVPSVSVAYPKQIHGT
jgi:hypothetical protein